ncbi:hypothetical protein ABT120_28875 [Nonomuraea angiospora]|uniref:hypothetical protein n=1 Tax=Nonomuraea angiospora TaxID=46172 RepID=UPI00331BA7C6
MIHEPGAGSTCPSLADHGVFVTPSQVVAVAPDDLWAFGRTETGKDGSEHTGRTSWEPSPG